MRRLTAWVRSERRADKKDCHESQGWDHCLEAKDGTRRAAGLGVAALRGGGAAKSAAALTTLHRICEAHLAGRYQIEVIDLRSNPRLAHDDGILAVPALVRIVPGPIRKINGDLTNPRRLLAALGLRPGASASARSPNRGKP